MPQPEILPGISRNSTEFFKSPLLNEGEHFFSLNRLTRLVTKSPVLQYAARGAGISLAALVLALIYSPYLDKSLAQAESLLFPPSTPKAGKLDSVPSSCGSTIQFLPQLESEFDIADKHVKWIHTPGYNINPPNRLEIPTSTFLVEINGMPAADKTFQPLQTNYESHADKSYGGTLGGLAAMAWSVNVHMSRFSMVTFTSGPMSNTWHMHFEEGEDPQNPEQYKGRVMVDDGFPAEGFSGRAAFYINDGSDTSSNWTNVVVIGNDNCSRDGTYQGRREANGSIRRFNKISNSIDPKLPYRQLLPTVITGNNLVYSPGN